MWRCLLLITALSGSLTFFCAGPAVGRASAAEVMRVRGGVAAISMDGRRVAVAAHGWPYYHVELGRRVCPRVLLRDLPTGQTRRLSRGVRQGRGGPTCGSDAGFFVFEERAAPALPTLALAGTRAAWITHAASITSVYATVVTSDGAGADREIEGGGPDDFFSQNDDAVASGLEYYSSNAVGLIGDRSFLGYNRFQFGNPSTCPPPPPVSPECAPARSGQALVEVRAGGPQALLTGDDALFAQAVDAGRVVFVRPDRGVVMRNLQTGQVVAYGAPGDRARTAGIGGRHVVVLDARHRLRVYAANSGRRLATWPVRRGTLTRVDVDHGVAVYATSRRIWAVRLRDGKTRALARVPTTPVGIDIEKTGVTWAWNTVAGDTATGHVGFIPSSAIARRFG